MKPLAVASILLLAQPARAEFVSGEQLHTACQAKAGSALNGFCVGYVTGVLDMAPAQQTQHYCLPTGTSAEQKAQAVEAFMIKYPNLRNLAGYLQIAGGMAEGFPCPKN